MKGDVGLATEYGLYPPEGSNTAHVMELYTSAAADGKQGKLLIDVTNPRVNVNTNTKQRAKHLCKVHPNALYLVITGRGVEMVYKQPASADDPVAQAAAAVMAGKRAAAAAAAAAAGARGDAPSSDHQGAATATAADALLQLAAGGGRAAVGDKRPRDDDAAAEQAMQYLQVRLVLHLSAGVSCASWLQASLQLLSGSC